MGLKEKKEITRNLNWNLLGKTQTRNGFKRRKKHWKAKKLVDKWDKKGTFVSMAKAKFRIEQKNKAPKRED